MFQAAAPPVRIRESDFHRLSFLTGHTAEGMLESASLLHEELLRARRVPDEEIGTVQIGMTVRYRDLADGTVHDVRLNYPKDALFQPGSVSVLSPLGAALIGLAPGSTMSWLQGDGRSRAITILAIDPLSPAPSALHAVEPS